MQKLEIIKDFIGYVQQELAIEQLPNISFTMEREFATSHRSFGAYMPEKNELIVYIGNRNTADILRTVAHELCHHRQKELGMEMDGASGSEIENEANSIAGVLMRNYGKTHELIYERVLAKKRNNKLL